MQTFLRVFLALWLLVHAYLDDFGHEEADVLREAKALIEKLSKE